MYNTRERDFLCQLWAHLLDGAPLEFRAGQVRSMCDPMIVEDLGRRLVALAADIRANLEVPFKFLERPARMGVELLNPKPTPENLEDAADD